jgi:hypothetical protein
VDPSDAMRYLSASGLLVGGVAATIGWMWLGISDPTRSGTRPGRYASNGLVITGGALIAFGLPAIHTAQADESGWVGAAAIFLLFIGMVTAYVAVHTVETVNAGLPRNAVPLTRIAVPCLFVGATTTAVVSLQAGVVPVGLPILLLVAILAGGLTLVPSIPRRLSILISAPFTSTLAAWGFVLVRDLPSG